MKVRLTKMHYIEGQGRLKAGDVMEWPDDKPLGRNMVELGKELPTPSIDGRRKGPSGYNYTQPVPGAKPAPVTVRQFGDKAKLVPEPKPEPASQPSKQDRGLNSGLDKQVL